MKKTIKDRRGACVQAERKSSTSTLIPDLDNANVGTYMIVNLREILWYLLFYVAI